MTNSNHDSEEKVETSNFYVPFDFNGDKFLYVDFLEGEKRKICVYTFEDNKKWEYAIDSSFGQITHLRFYFGKILIVRWLNIVEIREMNDDFKIVHEFKSKEEILDLDVYLHAPSKILANIPEIESDNLVIENKIKEIYIKFEDKNMNEKVDKNILDKNKSPTLNENKIENEVDKELFNEENVSIAILDINANVHVWENYSLSTRFNIYDFPEITQDIKDKEFFSMGYNYFIKTSKDFYAISTDFAVYIIKKVLSF